MRDITYQVLLKNTVYIIHQTVLGLQQSTYIYATF